MRSTFIIIVVVIKLIYCAQIGFSENDKLQNVERNKDLEPVETYKAILPNPDAFPIRKGSVGTTEKQFFVNQVNPYNQVTSSIKEKRCQRLRSELFEKVGSPKKFHKTSLKEIVGAKQKKRCDTCRESVRCKTQGKCDLCNRYCKDVDSTTLPPPTEAPLVGSIQMYLEGTKLATEQTPDMAPFGKPGRYYTIGAFGPGPKQNLIVRLMNVARKNSLGKLVVLAKPTGNAEDESPEHPIIIDTANAFQTKDNSQNIHAKVHTVNGNALHHPMDLDLTSKIDRELDNAIAEKQRSFGRSYLTNNEIDQIIDKVLSTVDSPHVVEIGSRSNIVGTPHLTTKRSVSEWPLNKNRNEEAESPVDTRFPYKGEDENLPPQHENEQTEGLNATLHSNKITTLKSKTQNQYLDKIVGISKAVNNYKGDSYIVEDNCDENADTRNNVEDNSPEAGEEVLEYEPVPPTEIEDEQPIYEENVLKNIPPVSPSEGQKTPNILSVPISNNQKLESASQRLENPEEHQQLNPLWNNPSQQLENPEEHLQHNRHLEEPPQQNPLRDIPIQQVNLEPTEEYPRGIDDDADVLYDDDINGGDVIVTLTQAPETYDSTINDSDPILGKSWLSNELEEAKHWWRNNVGMKTPQNFSENVINIPRINENQIDDKLLAESKTNLINASQFTLILKNLEQKVENIAELVKKTCGKLNPEEENVGAEEPTFIRSPQEENVIPKSGDTKAAAQPALSRNHPQVIEVPESDTTDFQITTPFMETERITADPQRNHPPHILDTAVNGLHEGANLLINKAVNIADKLQGGAFSPKRILNKPVLQEAENHVVGAAKSDHKLFSQDIPVGCSKEDSEEYVAERHTDNNGNTQDPTVACKEDSEEYVGETPNGHPIQLRSGFKSETTPTLVEAKTEKNLVPDEPQHSQTKTKKIAIKPSQNPSKISDDESKSNDDNGKSKQQEEDVVEINQDKNNKEIKQEASKTPQENEEVGCKEESEEYVGGQNTENLPETTTGNETVGCSKEEDEYIVPVYQPNSYRNSNANPKSSLPSPDFPKHKLPHIPTLDSLLHRNALPHPLGEGSLPFPKPGKSSLLKPSRIFNLNRDHKILPQESNVPEDFSSDPEEKITDNQRKPSRIINLNRDHKILPQESNIPEDFSSDPEEKITDNRRKPSRIFNLNRDHKILPQESNVPEDFSSDPDGKITDNQRKPSRIFNLNRDHKILPQESNVPEDFSSDPEEKIMDNQRFIDEPAHSEFAQNIDQPHRTNKHITRSKILEPQEDVDFPFEPNQQQLDTDLPLHDDGRILSPVAFDRQHSHKVQTPPDLSRRFGEPGHVGPDSFYVHRPKSLLDWPQLTDRGDVLGAANKAGETDDVDPQISSATNTQNPFTIFGKVVPQLNNTEVSFHDISNNKIYFMGTGMQLPLNMKKDEDGTYQLSVDVDKLCNNCKGSACNKKSKTEEGATSENETGKNVPEASEAIQVIDYNKKTENNRKHAGELKNHSEFKVKGEQKLDDFSSKHKIEGVAMKIPNFHSRRFPSSGKIHQETPASTEPQFFEPDDGEEADRQKTFKHQPPFDTERDNERKHSKRSLGLVFPSLGNNSDKVKRKVLDGRRSEASSGNTVDVDPLDESLKKIDDNMKRYFNRRQKLDDFYKDQVRRNLEQPDDSKDVVKRRVTLVNNVLAWMKSIAVQNPDP